MGEAVNNVTNGVYADYAANGSGLRIDTNLVLHESIRAAHPDQHLTVIDPDNINLLEFGAAGLASVRCLSRSGESLRERMYKPPVMRMDDRPGKLWQRVAFGAYEVEWQGRTWTFYLANGAFSLSITRKGYLLSSDEPDGDGHSPATDALIMAVGKWTSQLHDEIDVFDNGRWRKDEKLWQAVQSATWDDVIIDPSMKDTIIQDLHSFFDSRSLFEEFGVPWKRGLIFHGTPGCGKTISIKALMNSLGHRTPSVASLYVKSFDSCEGSNKSGASKASIRSIFERARVMAPCMLILEDLDSLVVDQVRSYFLNEVDGLERNDGILIIGTTNHLDRLDPGIAKRPSRFDRKYFYKMPGKAERIRYCEYWRKKLERNGTIDFDPEVCEVVAQMTEGFSFAYLKELFVQTLLSIVSARVDADEAIVVSTEGDRADEADAGDLTTTAADGTGRRMPRVDVPERLKDNQLLRLLRKQHTALWKDMDNTGNSAETLGRDAVAEIGEDDTDYDTGED